MAKTTKKPKKKITLRGKLLQAAGEELYAGQKLLLSVAEGVANDMGVTLTDLFKSMLPRSNSIAYHMKKMIACRMEDELIETFSQRDLPLESVND